ncbi:NAD(P)-dependent oxidoreductase [Vibrio sp. D420a]|uniref:NAD(P)-dependent oxidoreductase n=1 Tax=Vibrio sp. D420a TaxID=2836895 RepID=UPI00255666D7|nr:NAD(P)-dependent oxidoreductase [Vibrio sp. D420a]MDK9760740.1 NAD(P)-dependent oxidoreductase [Vibrio sp. D420a]
MKVLISGSNGYVGRHVTQLFKETRAEVYLYDRGRSAIICPEGMYERYLKFEDYFDVVINCARPHWSEYSPPEIANIESKLLLKLDSLAKVGAIKIHTSGVWLFGKANYEELRGFKLKPLSVVEPDVTTIERALRHKWHVVYCPSLVYGGENCQLMRVVETLDGSLSVATPTLGHNQYIHVEDIAYFYLCLVQNQPDTRQHFIAEKEGYTPADFGRLLLQASLIKKISNIDWMEFESRFGSSAVEIERLNLELPVSPMFKSTSTLRHYIENSFSKRHK